MTNIPNPRSDSAEAQQIAKAAGPIQPRLVLSRPRDERANPELLARLVAALDGRGWVKRKVLRAELAVSDDALRDAARHSRGVVVGSSYRGYGLTVQVSVEDAQHAISELLSRARQCRLRARDLLRVVHRPHRVLRDGLVDVQEGRDAAL